MAINRKAVGRIDRGEEIERGRVWRLAEEYYVANKAHEFPPNNTLEVCIESNRKGFMTDSCWMILKTHYSLGE